MTEPNSIDPNSRTISVYTILEEISKIAFESKGVGAAPFEQALERYSQDLASQILQHINNEDTTND